MADQTEEQKQAAAVAAAADAAAKQAAAEEARTLIKMRHKDHPKPLRVHPLCVAAHEAIGWKRDEE